MTATPARCRHCRSPFPSTAARDDHEPRCGADLAARTKTLRTVETAARRLVDAHENRDRAIRDALAAGLSTREIGRAAGLTHVRVMQICHRETEPAAT